MINTRADRNLCWPTKTILHHNSSSLLDEGRVVPNGAATPNTLAWLAAQKQDV